MIDDTLSQKTQSFPEYIIILSKSYFSMKFCSIVYDTFDSQYQFLFMRALKIYDAVNHSNDSYRL